MRIAALLLLIAAAPLPLAGQAGPVVSTAHPDRIKSNGDVFVSGMQRGVAHVRAANYSADLATVTVLPPLLPVEIHTAAARVARGQEVVLTAVLPGYDEEAMFSWYRGRIGDFTRPIQTSNGPNLTFIAIDPGVSSIWVQAIAGTENRDEAAARIIAAAANRSSRCVADS